MGRCGDYAPKRGPAEVAGIDMDSYGKLTPDEYRQAMRIAATERRKARALSQSADRSPRSKGINWAIELPAAVAANETARRLSERLGCAESAVRHQAKKRGFELAKYLRSPSSSNVYYAIEKTKENVANSRLGAAFAMSAQNMENAATQAPLGIYVISEAGQTFCKVGIASSGEKRLTQLQLGNVRRLTLELFKPVPNPRRTEYAAHSQLWTRHEGGEWFNVSPADALAAVEAALGVVEGLNDADFVYKPLAGDWTPQHEQFSYTEEEEAA